VRYQETDGNFAVVEGARARALAIPIRDAVLVELRNAAAGLLSAAVRLERLPLFVRKSCSSSSRR
jgi:urease accessory protein UreF